MKKVRVLVIDDSTFNRRSIISMLESSGEVDVVGSAADGEEGLKKSIELKPDVVTLDLEMPKMDGFTFLRLLLSRQPTSVIIISSNSQKQNVFKGLELGALDFLAKPSRHIDPGMSAIRDELLKKVLVVRQLRRRAFKSGIGVAMGSAKRPPERAIRRRKSTGKTISPAKLKVVALGASTGGPSAITRILRELKSEPVMALLITVHMPAKFTKAFADRLNKLSRYNVEEAKQGMSIMPGTAFVAPGGKHMVAVPGRPWPKIKILDESGEAKYRPSVDLLFSSCSKVFGKNLTAFVLTGMGDDGKKGIKLVKEQGGTTIVESEDTAIVFGMPHEAFNTGAVDRKIPLDEIPAAIDALVSIRG
ncbi:MAG: chemotaxis-specific protein-glutamate methyltransferase CheB [Deltaproteobacteria bacterium]|nr:chemotaxis-specific protein-glutamate methyltransferase CheB [Deltaproteobacteria bacterium]